MMTEEQSPQRSLNTAPARVSLNARLVDYRTRRVALDAEWEQLRSEEEALTKRELNDLTDADILGSEFIRGWLCEKSWGHSGASRRLRALTRDDKAHLHADGVDARDEYVMRSLPFPRIRLPRQTNLAAVEAGIRRFNATWGLGRYPLLIGVTNPGLSESGVHTIEFKPDAETEAAQRITRYGRPSEITSGSMLEVLSYVARHYGHDEV